MRGPGEPGPRKLRLFFALWPEPPLRQALAAASQAVSVRIDGEPVPPGNLHVTLAFLGSVPGRGFAELVGVGGRADGARIALRFDRLEYWAKPRVLAALPATVPAEGRAIVERLWHCLEPLGFEREQRPWQPHLTLCRRIRRPPPVDLAIPQVPSEPELAGAWRLALVESVTRPDGPRYKPLADWPLGEMGTFPFSE